MTGRTHHSLRRTLRRWLDKPRRRDEPAPWDEQRHRDEPKPWDEQRRGDEPKPWDEAPR